MKMVTHRWNDWEGMVPQARQYEGQQIWHCAALHFVRTKSSPGAPQYCYATYLPQSPRSHSFGPHCCWICLRRDYDGMLYNRDTSRITRVFRWHKWADHYLHLMATAQRMLNKRSAWAVSQRQIWNKFGLRLMQLLQWIFRKLYSLDRIPVARIKTSEHHVWWY